MYQMQYEVKESDIQPVYCHVNHARIVTFMETARLGMLESIGFPNDRLIEMGFASVIVRLEIDYKRAVKQGPVTFTCEDMRVEGKTLLLRQRIINDRGKDAVVAEAQLKFLSPTLKRAVPPPPEFCEALKGRSAELQFRT